jgi:hypothetical protein
MTAATSNAAARDAGQELAAPLESASMTYVPRPRVVGTSREKKAYDDDE